MKDKIGLQGHEPSVGISNLFIKFFREGSFDIYDVFMIVFFINKRIYTNREAGRTRR